MAKNNSSSSTNSRSSGRSGSSSANRAPFYAVLLVIVLGGIGAILYLQKKPSAAQNNAAYEELRSRFANAGPPQPYILGDTNAPVVIEEFADYECPSCANYAVITEPDVKKRIIHAGLAYYKFYDFPLPMHKHAPSAALAAACADEQQKFWEMHDQIFIGQDQWGMSPTGEEVVSNPKSVFKGFAEAAGLNVTQWESCYDGGKYNSRVAANAAEAVRRNVESTPTFFINGKRILGAISYDEMKKHVDEAAVRGPATAMDSAVNNVIQHQGHGH
jgi:protein-disulfide isomerase